jgi:hypothetical protein
MSIATDRGRFEMIVGSSASSSRSPECFQEVGSKEGMVEYIGKANVLSLSTELPRQRLT